MVSIVIPLYNKAQSITNTIACIQNQTYQDFEIVVIEGWSTDGSLEIIKDLAEKDKRIHVFMQKNRNGVTPARNESIDEAKCEHIFFMDADDYWEPTYLETMVNLINDYPDAGIWGMNHGEISGGVKCEIKCPVEKGFRGVIDNPWVVGSPYWTSATAVSKKAVEKIGGFDNRIIFGEDIDLWYRLMLEFPAVFENGEALSYYRVDAENRACNKLFPLKIHIPYYIEKYNKYRAANKDFRKFIDLQFLYRLYPYALSTPNDPDVKRVLSQIDFSLQKSSMKLRFKFPNLYHLYMRLVGRA